MVEYLVIITEQKPGAQPTRIRVEADDEEDAKFKALEQYKAIPDTPPDGPAWVRVTKPDDE